MSGDMRKYETDERPFRMTLKDSTILAETFNVANETGLTPRQLADQNNAMLVVLRGLADHDFGANGDPVTYEALCKSARALIAKCTGEA